MSGTESIPVIVSSRGKTATGSAVADALYKEAAADYGAPLARLARAYEADPEKRRDLLQEIHLQLWRSFRNFDSRCSIRTWVYRVAHHTAASHVIRERRRYAPLVSLEELTTGSGHQQDNWDLDQYLAWERLSALIERLKPLDRQVIVSYLEGLDANSIGEVTGLSPGNVAMKIHRIKQVLTRQFHEGEKHAR